jgi:hypothetical protein
MPNLNRGILMPDLSHARHGFRHTLDSALEVLAGLGVSPDRITLEMAGRGWPTHTVVAQEPAAGASLGLNQAVALWVAGSGVFFDLPSGMWDLGGEPEPGTGELITIFDDPLQKMAHWIRQGGLLFDVRKDNPEGIVRWISLFGIRASDWPAEVRYDLALLLPSLQRLAGKESGMRFVFRALLKLPLQEIQRRPGSVPMAHDQVSRLGEQNNRLSLEMVVGDRRPHVASWRFVFGPVPPITYYQYRSPDYVKLLRAALDLVAPCYQPFETAWSVLDANRAPRLGYPLQNGVLGVNTHLGREMKATP